MKIIEYDFTNLSCWCIFCAICDFGHIGILQRGATLAVLNLKNKLYRTSWIVSLVQTVKDSVTLYTIQSYCLLCLHWNIQASCRLTIYFKKSFENAIYSLIVLSHSYFILNVELAVYKDLFWQCLMIFGLPMSYDEFLRVILDFTTEHHVH